MEDEVSGRPNSAQNIHSNLIKVVLNMIDWKRLRA